MKKKIPVRLHWVNLNLLLTVKNKNNRYLHVTNGNASREVDRLNSG